MLGEAEGAASFSELLGDPGAAPDVAFDPPNDIAAVPYSSGTTGLSKGVMLSHRNLIANVIQTDALLALSPDDVLMAALPLFHHSAAPLSAARSARRSQAPNADCAVIGVPEAGAGVLRRLLRAAEIRPTASRPGSGSEWPR